MAASVIVYSSNDGSIRRVILPDTDVQGQTFLTALAPGEAALTMAQGKTLDTISVQAAIQAVRGVPCASGRCVVVNAGVVVDTAMADPLIDTHSQGQLVSHDTAAPGDKFDGAQFTRLAAVINTVSNRVISVGFAPLALVAAPNTAVIQGPTAQGLKVGDLVAFRAVAAV